MVRRGEEDRTTDRARRGAEEMHGTFTFVSSHNLRASHRGEKKRFSIWKEGEISGGARGGKFGNSISNWTIAKAKTGEGSLEGETGAGSGNEIERRRCALDGGPANCGYPIVRWGQTMKARREYLKDRGRRVRRKVGFLP